MNVSRYGHSPGIGCAVLVDAIADVGLRMKLNALH